MRSSSAWFLVMMTTLAACAAPDLNGTDYRHGDTSAKTDSANGVGDDDDGATSDTTTTPGATPTTTVTPPSPPPASAPDADNDGVPDSTDCAPNDPSIAGTRLALDPLATEGNLFTVATGFPTGDWTYNGAYEQTRLANLPDVTLLNKDAQVTDAIVSVTAASTEISSTITPTLRQMFITFGSSMSGGVLTAVGCGVEVDASANPTQQTSVIRLNGDKNGISTLPLNRVGRGAVQVNEEFTMKGTLRAGVLTCDATIGGTTTTAKANVGTLTGSIGFYVKQTKALFKSIDACKLK